MDSGDDDRHHQIYDAAMKQWAGPNLPEVAAWLDPTVAGLPPVAYGQRPASLTAQRLEADFVATAGRNRLLHVEFETEPRKILVTRMLNYRARLMALRPEVHLTQHVIVLGNGTVSGYRDGGRGFTLDLQVVYLRDRDPASFLKDPVLAPFAALAKGSRVKRERSFGAALRLLRARRHPRSPELIQIAETLASIRLERSTIERIREENGMNLEPLIDYYGTTVMGERLKSLGRQRGHEEGFEVALAVRFGDVPGLTAVARHLASWPPAAAADAIRRASTPADLLTALPPGPEGAT